MPNVTENTRSCLDKEVAESDAELEAACRRDGADRTDGRDFSLAALPFVASLSTIQTLTA